MLMREIKKSPKEMEGYTMFTNYKTQLHKEVNSLQINL